jgi:hypothetical protein
VLALAVYAVQPGCQPGGQPLVALPAVWHRFELPRRVRKVYSGPRLYEALQLQSSAGPST